MYWIFIGLTALFFIGGVVALVSPSLNRRDRARLRFVGWCFQMALLAMLGAAVLRPSPMQDTYDTDYLRQSAKTDKLQAEMEEDGVRYRRLLLAQERDQLRNQGILEKWDALLDAQAKKSGIKVPASDP